MEDRPRCPHRRWCPHRRHLDPSQRRLAMPQLLESWLARRQRMVVSLMVRQMVVKDGRRG
ncbi:hypothetical protein BC831DRAFT_492687 [Entophlyctis helioformis]|nr:hypothetical protein BC831DRAFT_492687 [Entophlyctis helioformis]